MIINVKYPKPKTILFKDLPEGAMFTHSDPELNGVSIKLYGEDETHWDNVYNALDLNTYSTLYHVYDDEEVIPLQPCGEFNFKILE